MRHKIRSSRRGPSELLCGGKVVPGIRKIISGLQGYLVIRAAHCKADCVIGISIGPTSA